MTPRLRSVGPPRHILIAGCGYVGSALARSLAAAGDVVWGLKRSAEGLPGAVRPLVADLAVPESLLALPPDLDSVVYSAAPDASSDAAYRAAYVEGLSNLLDALQRQAQAPRRVLFTSSTGVYAQRDGGWVDEDSPAAPASYSGRRLLEAERLLLSAAVPATIVRFGGIYGPGRTRLLDDVRAGVAVCPDGPPRWSNRIHRDDCAGVLQHLLASAAPAAVYIAVDREPAPLCEILDWLAERLEAPQPRRVAAETAAPAPRGGRSNKRCSSGRLVASGYEFRYPSYREGFAALIEASGAE